jgi:two-component sensor histidine kinase
MPGTSGFGTRLIDRTIRSLGGTIEIRFDEAGLRVAIDLPC